MQWTRDLAVGIGSIDDQHKELFRRINSLITAIKEKRCKTEIDGMIKFLDDYARFHFREEEDVMRKSGYEGLRDHQQHHAIYLRNIAELKEMASLPRVQGMSYELSVTVNEVLVNLIVDHIMKIDKMFAEYIRRKGARK